jgi:hypothetical protein
LEWEAEKDVQLFPVAANDGALYASAVRLAPAAAGRDIVGSENSCGGMIF